jgi:alkylation response protein AidB-like acyl-CoA dehydrogenase
VALLTPIVKAFLTDNGWIATSHCMQVFGGHGYIRNGAWSSTCAMPAST